MVEIIAYAPTAFYHCTHCEVAWREIGVSNQIHEEQSKNSLPGDLAQDYQAVSDWVRAIFRQHGDRVVVKVIDAASAEGVFKSLRYGARHYPAVIVAGKLCRPEAGANATAALDAASQQITEHFSGQQPAEERR